MAINPFVGVDRVVGNDTALPATRVQAYQLADALEALGQPLLALVPIIAFEWVQRPTNIVGGHITWTDYRGTSMPQHVRVFHHKTGEAVWLPLVDHEDGTLFYPELEEKLAHAERLGVPMVIFRPKRGPRSAAGEREPRLYAYSTAQHHVQRARALAGLPDHVTLEACRHGGMTKLGDAGTTEAEVMAHSGHRTPAASRLYVKRTENQRRSAARKRRALVASANT